ncbi:MAG TPA: hypothetical protein VGM64_06400 [Lacunisphaera sp.]
MPFVTANIVICIIGTVEIDLQAGPDTLPKNPSKETSRPNRRDDQCAHSPA